MTNLVAFAVFKIQEPGFQHILCYVERRNFDIVTCHEKAKMCLSPGPLFIFNFLLSNLQPFRIFLWLPRHVLMALHVLFCKDLMVNVELSCKNVRAFSKICYFHSTVWAVGTRKYLKSIKLSWLIFRLPLSSVQLIRTDIQPFCI